VEKREQAKNDLKGLEETVVCIVTVKHSYITRGSVFFALQSFATLALCNFIYYYRTVQLAILKASLPFDFSLISREMFSGPLLESKN